MRKLSSFCLIIQLLYVPMLYARNKTKKTDSAFNLQTIVLPSEVNNLSKTRGAIYYSPSVKGKVLIPVHFWGEVSKSGLHYVPVGTTLLNGLSLAGGPRTSGDLENVKLTRKIGDHITEKEFDLSEGGDILAYKTELQPNDTIFIPKDTFTSNRAYYTSLVGVVATILSSILLYRQVKN